jgi:hypothetical protein
MFSTPMLLIGRRLRTLLILRRLVRSNIHRRVLVNHSPYDFYTLSSTFICTYHPFNSIVLFVLSQAPRSFWFSLLSSEISLCLKNHHFPSAQLILPFFPSSFYCFQFPPLTASFSVFVCRIYLPFFPPPVDGITLSFLSPLLVCYRLDLVLGWPACGAENRKGSLSIHIVGLQEFNSGLYFDFHPP